MTTSAAVPGRAETAYHFGAARVDITPDGPVRLSGYGGRREEAAKVAQRLWGKALALREGDGPPLLLLAVDSIGVPAVVTEEVAERVRRKTGLPRERLALASTHSHTAPCLKGNLETLFGVPVPPDHQERIDRYTRELTDKLERAALDALAGKERCTLAWAVGRAGFATNRRTPGGPTDHGLPVLRVADGAGKVRVVVASYACHSTTLGPELNEVCGDWAGYAQEGIEEAMVYYDKPARLRPEVEEMIVRAAHGLLPGFVSEEHRAENPPPRSPEESRALIRTVPDMQVELVAAEPLVVDPVAIDFGLDGRVWVVEMRD